MGSRRLLLSSILVFLVLSGLVVLVSAQLHDQQRDTQRASVEQLALSGALSLERELAGSLSALHSLSMTVRPNGEVEQFEFAAAALRERFPAIDALALLPNGRDGYVHPAGSEVFAPDLDVHEVPGLAAGVERAEDTRAVVLDASLRSGSGARLLVAWLPLVALAGGERIVWGHAAVSMRVSELVLASDIARMTEAGYHYQLLDLGRSGESRLLHTALPDRPIDSPVDETIAVPGGTWRLSLAPMGGWDNHGRMAGYLMVGFGIALALTLLFHAIRLRTEQRRVAEAALIDSEIRYSLAVEGVNDGIWDWNLKTGEVYYSSRWRTMLGCSAADIGDGVSAWMDRVHPDDQVAVQDAIAAHVAGHVPHFEVDYRLRHASGAYRWMKSRGVAINDESGAAVRMAGSQTDITQQKRVEEQLLHDTLHDALTGLPNRTLLIDRLEHVIVATRRRGSPPFAVLFLDLDRFKVVNDSLGHHVGDGLLMGIAERVEACLRPGDTMARLGGDEFAILLPELAEQGDASVVADRVHGVLAEPFRVDGHEIFASASIGIASGCKDTRGAMEFLRDADTAMYRAKASGRGCHVIFDGDMHAVAARRQQLETDLRHAVSRRQLHLHYQPVLQLPLGEIVGFEALVRWKHPELGRVSPADLIPIAEETGLIVPIGEWILNEACNQLRRWRRRAPHLAELTVAVNLSGKQLQEPGLVDVVQRALSRSRLAPEALVLEITESVIMEQVDTVMETLERLRELGVELHIDDFGTGYSSLAYLTRFPVDTLKIDRSFVSRLCEDQSNARIARAVATLAHDLGMKVVAEGVERDAQLKRLQLMGVDQAQGHYFSKPLPAYEITQLLERPEGLALRPAAG